MSTTPEDKGTCSYSSRLITLLYHSLLVALRSLAAENNQHVQSTGDGRVYLGHSDCAGGCDKKILILAVLVEFKDLELGLIIMDVPPKKNKT